MIAPASRSDRTLRWNFFKNVLKAAIGIGLIVFLFSCDQIDISQILRSYRNFYALLAGVLCCTAACATIMVRWWILTCIQQLNVTFFDALRLTMISLFFSIFAPGAVGGDVVRALYAVRESPDKKPRVLTVAIFDRGLGLHALLLVAGAVFCMQPALFDAVPGAAEWLTLAVCLSVGVMLAPGFLIWERTNRWLLKLCGRVVGGEQAWRDALRFYRSRPGLLCCAYMCSIGNIVFSSLLIHSMMLAVGSNPDVLESLTIAPLVTLANMLPFSPGGIGIAEAASAGLYDAAGHAGGANAMILTRIVVIVHAVAGVFFFLFNKKFLSYKKEVPKT